MILLNFVVFTIGLHWVLSAISRHRNYSVFLDFLRPCYRNRHFPSVQTIWSTALVIELDHSIALRENGDCFQHSSFEKKWCNSVYGKWYRTSFQDFPSLEEIGCTKTKQIKGFGVESHRCNLLIAVYVMSISRHVFISRRPTSFSYHIFVVQICMHCCTPRTTQAILQTLYCNHKSHNQCNNYEGNWKWLPR